MARSYAWHVKIESHSIFGGWKPRIITDFPYSGWLEKVRGFRFYWLCFSMGLLWYNDPFKGE